MHILIDCTSTQNQLNHHGPGQYTKHVVEGLLKEKDIDFTLLLFDGESTLDSTLRKNLKNVKVVRLGKLRKSDYLNIIWYVTQILPAIKRNRREDSIYFCPYFWTGIPSLWIPTVLMVHDMTLPLFNIYSEQSIVHNLIKRILYWLELIKARYCKAIITNSYNTTEDFKKYFPKYPKENIYTIYLAGELKEGDTSGWSDKLPKDYEQKGYFIYMGGTLYKNKNSDGVIKGYKNFLSKFRNINDAPYLVIAGKNFTKNVDPNVVIFKNKIHCLGMDKKVVFTGFYEDAHAKPLLENSIAFIHLSLYEGFGMALIDAMKAKTPVIAHRGSSYIEVVKDAGILVNGLDDTEVGREMFNLYSDKNLRESLREEGAKRADEFSWQETTRKTLRVFQDVSAN